ncbi:ScbR family autoregulator-binding transcription factor [Streptomyces kunmingensis]|uniref:ScbR family autoregulator-binding transcription factor n=1 Tax=Streptomyces kunmingensis TaxID=68225 RepID=A0ABU6C9E5_9ACTN|nr:ScbR family autoregulator-binding transcription factor [Streptomyces kunmingensis]MEB3960676.1 ScbR family autoregulator-binding transcription factor [Streptomyces kunmingensis]
MVKQERAARTRRALINAAAEAFADDGYALASLPAISKRAGVSTGALHFHFSSKDALAAAVESAAEHTVRTMAEQCGASTVTPLQCLVSAVTRLLDAVSTDPVTRAGLRLAGDPSRKSGGGLIRWWHEWVRDVLVAAAEAGELPRTVSPEGAAMAISAAVAGVGLLGGAFGPEPLAQVHLAQFREFLLSRLAVSPWSEQPGRLDGAAESVESG